MIRILVTILLIALIYVGINVLGHYDTTISIFMWDYRIDIKIFLLFGIIFLVASVLALGMKMVGMIFKIPYMIAQKLVSYKKRSRNKIIMAAYFDYLIEESDSAKRTLSKIDPKELEPELIEHVNLLNALCNQNFEKNMYFLEKLLPNKAAYEYVAKSLAKRLYAQGHYVQSLQYAELVPLVTNKDSKFISLLVKLYANLEIWDKCASYLDRYSPELMKDTEMSGAEISSVYLKIAKICLANGEDNKAKEFLQTSLEYDPSNIAALETLCKINLVQGQGQQNLDILEKAFAACPSFALFDLYEESSTMEPQEIYLLLTNLADIIQYREVFFAIAASCGLTTEIEELRKKSKIIS